MLSFLKSLLTTPERDGRRLYNDAVLVIQSDRESCSANHLQRAADLAREELAKLEKRLTANPNNSESFIYDLRQKHRDSRQRRDYALFTAMTLILIRLRAEKLGESGQAAITIVDEFITNPLGPDTDSDATAVGIDDGTD